MRNVNDIVYTYKSNDEEFTWYDILELCGGNETYAEILIERLDWEHPATLIDQDYLYEEIEDIENTIVMTGGEGNERPRNVISGEQAKEFYNQVWNQEDGYKLGTEYRNIGGYFPEVDTDTWIAFDYCNGFDCFSEEFDTEEEARKYASGVMATPRGWSEPI